MIKYLDPSDPDSGWKPLDFDAAIANLKKEHGADSKKGKFYESTINRLMAMIHEWRAQSLLHLIPLDCHKEFQSFCRSNAKRKIPKPIPFETWGLITDLMSEPAYEKKVGDLVVNKEGDESAGFEKRHLLIYGKCAISRVTYSMLPNGEVCDFSVGYRNPALWITPQSWSPFAQEKLGAMKSDATSVAPLGDAWISLAQYSRDYLINVVEDKLGHRYPPSACKFRFIASNKAATDMVEVEPDHPQAIPVWALGQLPKGE
tara:strand:+ start:1298 stop:2074 length:777 start_codon:yes stop_codon:yes gene_type:complete